MKKLSLAFAACLMLLACQAQNRSDAMKHLKSDVAYLASDSMKGRLSGSKECEKSAEYIRNQFKTNGLKLLCENGYQYFNIAQNSELDSTNYFLVDKDSVRAYKDYIPTWSSVSGKINGKPVFVGFGFDFDFGTVSWHDYQKIDVKGKWVVIIRGVPKNFPLKPNECGSNDLVKIMIARNKGAAGVIFVDTKEDESENNYYFYSNNSLQAGIPVLLVKQSIANKLLLKNMNSMERLEEFFYKELKPNSFELQSKISGEIKIIRHKIATANVVAQLEGKDSKLKEEYIVIGGHYDHVGLGKFGSRRGEGQIHNGADDNASGTAGVLELAREFSKKNLKRSLIFVAFSGEELGLYGSKYFVANPIIDLNQISFMCNLDMIGRMDSLNLYLYGINQSTELAELAKKKNENYHFNLLMNEHEPGGSDHMPFLSKKVPAVFFFGSLHEDYHTPDDDTEKINFEGANKILAYAYDIIEEAANRESKLKFDSETKTISTKSIQQGKILGVVSSEEAFEEGIKVQEVGTESIAEKAGIKTGDIIVSIDGLNVRNRSELQYCIAKAKKDQAIPIEILRDTTKKTITVKF